MKYLLSFASYFFVIGMSLSTLTWIRIYTFNSINIGYSHLFLIIFNLLLVIIYLLNFQKYVFSRHLKSFMFVISALIFFLGILYLSSQIPLRDFLRPFAYFINALSFSFLIYYSSEKTRKLFVILPFLISLVFVAAMLYSSTFIGLDIFRLISDSLTQGDSSILLFGVFGRLFSSGAFGTELEFIKINLRHEISSLLLFGIYLSITFLPYLRPGTFTFLGYLGLFSSLMILVILMSRSALLALLLSLLHLYTVSRNFRRKYLSVLVILIFSIFLFFAQILYSRFFLDTTSYTGRIERLDGTLNLIFQNPFFPSDQLQSVIVGNSHMWFFELWKLGGISGFILSFLFLSYLVYFLLQSHLIFYKLKPYQSSYYFSFLCLWLPVVRIFTAGSALGLSEWLCIGLFIGVFNILSNKYCAEGKVF